MKTLDHGAGARPCVRARGWRRRRWRKRPRSRSTRRSRTTSSAPFKRRSRRRCRKSRSCGCATPPASSRRASSPRRTIRAPTWCSAIAATSLLLFEKVGLLETYKPTGVDALKAVFRDATAPYTWTGMDAYPRRHLLQHRRRPARQRRGADLVEGPAQARVQGQDRDAASGLVRHRLPDGRRLAADDGRGGRLEVHGRAAREHRRLYAFGLGALRAGRAAASASPASRSTCAAPRRRPRARRSRSSCRRKAPAGRWKRPRIVKGTKNLELAKKVADWGATKAANELYSKTYAIVAHAGRRRTLRRTIRPTAEKRDDQERLRLDGREPRAHPRRVVEALRVKAAPKN